MESCLSHHTNNRSAPNGGVHRHGAESHGPRSQPSWINSWLTGSHHISLCSVSFSVSLVSMGSIGVMLPSVHNLSAFPYMQGAQTWLFPIHIKEHLLTCKLLVTWECSFIPNLSDQQEIFGKCELAKIKISLQGWHDLLVTLPFKFYMKQTKNENQKSLIGIYEQDTAHQ